MSNKLETNLDAQNLYTVDNLPAPANPGDIATKGYVDAQIIAAKIGALIYRGVINCAGNPNYPAGIQGDFYVIGTAGRIGGAFAGKVVESNDWLLCAADNAGGTEGAVGSSWDVAERNVDQASVSALGLVMLAATADVNTGTDPNKAITPLALAGAAFRQNFTQAVGDGAASSFTYTHGFTTRKFRTPSLTRTVSPFDAVTIYAITFPSTTTVTVDFGTGVPLAGEFQLVLEPIV